MRQSDELLPSELDALAVEAEHGYWCREPIGGGKTCNRIGRPVPEPPTPDRTVLCAHHGLGWGRDLWPSA